jgi:hypothetical protein
VGFRSVPNHMGPRNHNLCWERCLSSLTMQQFHPIFGRHVVLGLAMGKNTKMDFIHAEVGFGKQRQQVIGKNLQVVYFSQFLAKPGAGRAQLGVFGHYRAI